MVLHVFLALVLVALTGAWSSPVGAHAVLLGTTPGDGARLEAAPSEASLRFNEPVAPVVVRVLDGSGGSVALPSAPSMTDTVLRVPLPATLASGTYVVSYRVTSQDSHPVGGAFLFTIGQGTASGDALQSVRLDASLWQSLGVVLRTLFYIGLLAAAGGALFDMLVEDIPGGLRRRLGAFAAAAVLLGILGIGVQGGLLLNPPLSGLLQAETWRIGFASTRGTSMLLSLPGLLLLFITLRSGVSSRSVHIPGIALALSGFLVTGHAATASPVWLTAPAMALHALAVAFWVGALAPLVAVLNDRPAPQAAPVIIRFSRVAMVAVASLLLAGLALAIVQVADWAAMPATEYGLILGAKLAVVGGLLLVALYNKWRLTPALERAEPNAAGRLRGAIRLEMAAVAAIFVATASLGAVPPPRTMKGHYHLHPHGSGHTHDHDGAEEAVSSRGFKAVVHVETTRSGARHLHVTLSRPDGQRLAPLEVVAEISNDSAGIAGMSRKLSSTAPGEFALTDAPFTFAGIWTIDIDALISDFEKASWSVDVTVK